MFCSMITQFFSQKGDKALLGGEQALTPNFYLKSFVVDSVQVGKAVLLPSQNLVESFLAVEKYFLKAWWWLVAI